MRRRRRHRTEAKVSHDRWLLSYADFMTLLFALFVVMFAASHADKAKQGQLEDSIRAAFGRVGWIEPREKAAGAGQDDAMAAARVRVEATAGPEIRSGSVGLRDSGDGLVISLQEAGFFDSGGAEIRPAALPVLERIARALPNAGLRVEGHTDDVPIRTPQFASNWELSSARASGVARVLLREGRVRAERMSVSGYAEFHPVAGNGTAAGRARNRRVDIVVLR